MIESSKSDPPIALVLVHKAITRGLTTGIENAERFIREGYPDRATGAGFALYLRTLAGVLHMHHSAEDEIAFPFLRDKLPDLPFAALIDEHQQMESNDKRKPVFFPGSPAHLFLFHDSDSFSSFFFG